MLPDHTCKEKIQLMEVAKLTQWMECFQKLYPSGREPRAAFVEGDQTKKNKKKQNRANTIFAVAGENKDNLSVRKLRHTFFYVTYYIVFYVYYIILYYCHIIFITTTIILTIIVYIIIIRAGQWILIAINRMIFPD